MEVRCIDFFLNKGVTWPTIRTAGQQAADQMGTTHPFSDERFRTDGRTIFRDIAGSRDNKTIQDLVSGQYSFEKILAPYLDQVDFDREHNPLMWWPPAGNRLIVVDPARSFGQPIVDKESVPTVVLASAFKAEKSIVDVAEWYEVSTDSVEAAVNFETSLAA